MKIKLIASLALITLSFTGVADAAGIRLMETDNAGQGQAHAITASVDDAAAVYYNPAAMVNVKKYAAKAGFSFYDPTITFSSGETNVAATNETAPIPHGYIIKNMTDRGLAFGFGFFSNFGTRSNWTINGPFRYEATDTKLSSSTLSFNVAKRMSEALSIAGGVNYVYSDLKYNSMFPFSSYTGTSATADGYMVVDAEGQSLGFNLALLFTPNEKLKVGVTYRSRMDVKFNGNATIENFPGSMLGLLTAAGISTDDYVSTVDAEMTYPAIFVLAAAYDFNDKLTFEVDLDYTGWSSMDNFKFTFGSPLSSSTGSTILPAISEEEMDWDDTLTVRVGASFKHNEKTTIRVGYYYEPTPIPDKTFSPKIPNADRKLIALGLGYKANDNFTLDLAYSYLWSKSKDISNDVGEPTASVDGTYTYEAHIFGATFGYKF